VRERERWRETEAERERWRETEAERERDTDRHTDTQTHTDTERHRRDHEIRAEQLQEGSQQPTKTCLPVGDVEPPACLLLLVLILLSKSREARELVEAECTCAARRRYLSEHSCPARAGACGDVRRQLVQVGQEGHDRRIPGA
jgi:hypothetical protein